jgi:hypothetical protein
LGFCKILKQPKEFYQQSKKIKLNFELKISQFKQISDSHYNTWVVSIKSAGSFAALATAPVSSTFVTLDRIYAISFYSFGQRAKRIYIQMLSVFMLFGVFVSVFGILIWRIREVTTTPRTSKLFLWVVRYMGFVFC